jgi:hypothetical protein
MFVSSERGAVASDSAPLISLNAFAVSKRCRADRETYIGLALFAALVSAVPCRADDLLAELVPVRRSQLCVSEGALETLPDARLSVGVAKLRAVLAARGSQVIEARFSYLGPTAEMAPLRSGAVRQQFGLKLRAADGCNLVYAMWRFAPEPSLIVSVKRNPGLHASKACGNSGYRTVTPSRATPIEAPQIGTPHRLAAALDGAALHVFIDGRPVWDGELGPEVLDMEGPVGIRSDNARLELALFAPALTGQGICPNGAGAEEE